MHLMPRILFLVLAMAIVVAHPGLAHRGAMAQMQTGVAGGQMVGLKLIKGYREKPDPRAVPDLIRALSQQGAFRDPESSGVYVGFLAGVLGANPKTAPSLVRKIMPLPFEDQWLLIRAVAYSRLPNWPNMLRDLAKDMPDRRTMIEFYLSGKMPTLDDARLEPEAPRYSPLDKMRRAFEYETYFGEKKKPERSYDLSFVTNPELIDTHWGLYYANGKDAPLVRIATLLPWSTERDNIDKLTIGNMAKFTLAANAAYDVYVLAALRRLRDELTQDVRAHLAEVIEAAETSDTARIRKDALAAVDELRKKGPGTKRDIAWWGQVGQTVLSAGCLGASLAGQVEFGIPCVVGGAVSTAALRYFASPE